MKETFGGLLFTNLVDFDSKFGHRRNAKGYAGALEEFDARVPEILAAMQPGDLLMLCADHGNDPNHTGWDHTREAVPLLICGEGVVAGKDLGTRDSFADIAATILDYLEIKEKTPIGTSFIKEILK